MEREESDLRMCTFSMLVRTALAHCERWRDVFLRVDLGFYLGLNLKPGLECMGGLNLQLKRMPMLRSLEVENRVSEARLVGVVMAEHAALETICLKGSVKPFVEAGTSQQHLLEAGFPNMRRIHFKAFKINLSFVWEVLSLSPYVEELDLSSIPPMLDDMRSDPVPGLVFTKLKYLRLLVNFPQRFLEAMSKCSFPSLERLVLNGMPLHGDIFHWFPNFLRSLGSSLTHLHISHRLRAGQTISESAMVKVLRYMDRLRSLVLLFEPEFGRPDTLGMLRALLYVFQHEGEIIVPRLEIFHFSVHAPDVFDNRALLRELVVACHKRCQLESRRFTLQLDLLGEAESRSRAEELLKNDEGIRACSSATFHTGVNSAKILPL